MQLCSKYLFRSDHVEIVPGSDEYNSLTDNMKSECQGKTIYKSEVQFVDIESELHLSSDEKSENDNGRFFVSLKSLDDDQKAVYESSVKQSRQSATCPPANTAVRFNIDVLSKACVLVCMW